VDGARSRGAKNLSGDNLDFTTFQAPLAPLAAVKLTAHLVVSLSNTLLLLTFLTVCGRI
jgi:hypothetical protein